MHALCGTSRGQARKQAAPAGRGHRRLHGQDDKRLQRDAQPALKGEGQNRSRHEL